ncbi:DUF6615 family protein [Kribbella sp. CA-253562]|uniref:DUF6615 family protein n=1 Tax=Kribbella sp. CA-253562 TaxID=3239942 RepID=UPI003D91D1A7
MGGQKSREIIGQALKAKADWVNRRLTAAAHLGTPYGEETITETMLLDLRLELSGRLAVTPYTKYQESRVTGADWEWWFCDGIGRRMYGMRVQAKKLKLVNGSPAYDFAYRPNKRKERQVDRLLANARDAGLPAVYALYNGPELDLSLFAWSCCTEQPSASVFGVSMISAAAARRLADIGQTTLADAGALSLPWSCCALCPTPLRHKAWDLWPEGAGDEVTLFVADLVTDLLAKDGTRSVRLRELEAATGFRTWDEAPIYVRQMVEDARQETAEGVLRNELPIELPAGLGGVTAFIGRLPDPRARDDL